MNIENKIKLLERFKYNPSRQTIPLGAIIKENEFDSFESLIDSKELSFDFLRFLSVQSPENRKFIYDKLNTYDNIEQLTKLHTNEYPIVSKDNIKWLILYLKYENSISRNIDDFNCFLDSTNAFQLDNGYELTEYLFKKTKDDYYGINYFRLIQVLKNINFNEFSFEEVFEVISNANPSVDLSLLDKRTIQLYTDKISTMFTNVTEDNFNFVKYIEKLYGIGYLKSISLYIDDLLEYKESINSILEILDEDEHLKYLHMLINLFIICHRNEYTSLVKGCFDKLYMKMSYGSRVDSLHEMFQIGFEVDVQDGDNDISYLKILELAAIKSIGSKGLYKKVKTNSDLAYIVSNNIKYLSDVSHLINLGQLNESEIYTLIDELKHDYYRRISSVNNIPYKLSFKEFEYAVKYVLPKEVFEYVSKLKINSRIKVFDILMEANANNCDLYSTNNIIKNIAAEDLLKRHNVLGSSNIQDYIKWKMVSAQIGFEIDSLEELTKLDTCFDLCGAEYFFGVSKDNIDTHLLNNNIIKEGFEKLNISHDFVLKNISNAVEFIINGGFKIATSYFKNNYIGKLQRDNLTLIVKAILAGKYDALKFNYSDIFKEIEINMPESNFAAWATDHELANEVFTVKDAGDFNTIMTIGAKPVRSCMNYINGAYSQCLLSNIDTAKKILTIYKNGVYVGRAILRLTKSSSTGDNVKRLSFIDVENEVSVDIDNSDENLVLFVERLYTSLDAKDLNAMYDLMIEFLKFKSDLIGAKLMVSSSYTDVAEQSSIGTTIKPNYIFITASKNGEQYLDSFDGSTSSSCCYKGANVLLY